MAPSLITKKDLFKIVSDSKANMLNMSFPLYISDVLVEQVDFTTLAVLESVLMHLNSRGLLVGEVCVEYTDACAGHDPEPPLEERETQ
jgi:hypothetical protein